MGVDFVVESKGHCFICLNKIHFWSNSSSSSNSYANANSECSWPSSVVYSLQSLSRYLGMDMKRVFDEKDATDPQLFEQVAKSKLKAELCEGCTKLVDRFSKLRRHLEKIEMEVSSSLEVIHGKLVNAGRIGKIEEIDKLADLLPTSSRDVWKGKLDIFKTIRREAIEKGSIKIRDLRPRVRFPNLTKKEVTAKKHKLAANSKSAAGSREPPSECSASGSPPTGNFLETCSDENNDETDIVAVKQEEWPTLNSAVEDDGGNYHMDSEDLEWATSASLAPTGTQTQSTLEKETEHANEHPYIVIDPDSGDPNTKKMEYSIEPKTKKIKCGQCSMEFTTTQIFYRHYQSIHLNTMYKCRLCDKKFKQAAAIYRHHKAVHIGVRFKCRICSKLFVEKRTLMNHLKRSGCNSALAT